MQGKIIDIEGIDGAGKNSQALKIKNYIESKTLYQARIYSFPQYNTITGQVIAKYLKGEFGDINSIPPELVCMMYTANRASYKSEIENLLRLGYHVILDRYAYSNIFNAAKLPKEQQMPFIEWLEKMEFDDLGMPKPDYNFYLYIDPLYSLKRIAERGKREYQDGKEDIHENNAKLLIDTAECYLEFAKKKDNWFIIDQMKNGEQLNQDEVFEIIKEKLDSILEDLS